MRKYFISFKKEERSYKDHLVDNFDKDYFIDKSLDEVANATGLTRSAIFMYETEERIPRDENKVALAKYFGKSVQEIFFESECHET